MERFLKVGGSAGIVAGTAEDLFIVFFKGLLVEYVLTVIVIVVAVEAVQFAHMKVVGKENRLTMFLHICIRIVKHDIFILPIRRRRSQYENQRNPQNRRQKMYFE
jgi:hypothetical protein